MPRPQAERNFAKLPKWAQQHIQKLEQDLVFWEEKALAAASGSAGAPITVEVHGSDSLGLPDENIRFHPDPDDRKAWIEVRLLKGCIEVYAANALSIAPRSTNVVEVKLRGRPE